MISLELFWRLLPCKYRNKQDLEILDEEEDAFLLEDDAECEVLSDQKIISQILAVSSSPQPTFSEP